MAHVGSFFIISHSIVNYTVEQLVNNRNTIIERVVDNTNSVLWQESVFSTEHDCTHTKKYLFLMYLGSNGRKAHHAAHDCLESCEQDHCTIKTL